VLAPPWTETPASDWYAVTFKTAQYVYDRHDQLWLTAKSLQSGSFSMPGDARRLIEMVYSDEEPFPEALQKRATKAEGEAWAQASQAQMNTLSIDGGYKRGEIGDWWADTRTPSRLGEETKEVMLAKWVGGTLQPWHEGRWPYSMVKVSARNMDRSEPVASEAQEREYTRLLATLPSEGKYCVLLPLELQGDGSWQGRAWTIGDEKQRKPARLLTWLYDAELGLRMKESDAKDAAPD